MNHRSIRVILHGGLGNQLFQYFKACLEKERLPNSRVSLVGALLQRYGTARELELQPLVQGNSGGDVVHIQDISSLERIRLPKLLARLSKREFVLHFPGGRTVVDGYFQWPGSFAPYSSQAMLAVLLRWQDTLKRQGLLKPVQQGFLAHVRLGDFFHSREQARRFAVDYLAGLSSPAHLVTDQEDIVREALDAHPPAFDVKVLDTGQLDAWQLLSLMSEYRHIKTNGSSLAFWASALAQQGFNSSNADHERIRSRLDTSAASTVTPACTQATIA